MTQDASSQSLLKPCHRTLAFEEFLALVAMLVTLIVVASGYLLSDDSSVRARFILIGIEVVLFNLVAGLIASVLPAVIAAHRLPSHESESFADSTSAPFVDSTLASFVDSTSAKT